MPDWRVIRRWIAHPLFLMLMLAVGFAAVGICAAIASPVEQGSTACITAPDTSLPRWVQSGSGPELLRVFLDSFVPAEGSRTSGSIGRQIEADRSRKHQVALWPICPLHRRPPPVSS